MQHYIHENMAEGQKLGYAGPRRRRRRRRSATAHLHSEQQKALIEQAFGAEAQAACRAARSRRTSTREAHDQWRSIEVKVPQLSESVAEATLLQWKKKPGEAVASDEILIDIETDKVVLEVPAPAAGVLVEIVKADGSTVLAERGDRADRHRRQGGGRAGAASGRQPPRPQRLRPPRRGRGGWQPRAPSRCRRRQDDGRAATSPPAQVPGTGTDGRVTKGDVLGAVDSEAEAPPAARASAGTALRGPRCPTCTAPRRPARARRPPGAARADVAAARSASPSACVQSQSTAAILTTFNEVNMQPVMELRKRYKEKFEKEHGVKLGFMCFFVKAAVHALKKYPVVNASVDGNDIVYHGYFDIGIAVGSAARPGRADPAQRRPDVASPTSRRRSPTSASARRTASSRSRS